ncbi:hypothetical protein BHE74_00001251 [Ensete ventricosum]|nr:hypothetical protein BHE74_00001251 [Ensete ventricosum]
MGRRCSYKRHLHKHNPLLAVAPMSDSPCGWCFTRRWSSCGCRAHNRPPAYEMLPLRVAAPCGLDKGDCPHLLQPDYDWPPSFLTAKT